MNSETLRTPPSNLTAEKSVLGGLMLDLDKVDDIAPLIRADDFYNELNRIVFTTLLAMHEAGKPVNTNSLADELDRLGKFQQVGGVAFLTELMEAVPNAAHIPYDAKLVREAAQRRRVLYAARDLQAAACGHQDVGELLAMTERLQREVSEREEAGGCLSMLEVLLKRREALQQATRPHVPTGWPDLDSMLTGGMRSGSLVIVGARPSIGKSSWALGAFLSAGQAGHSAMFVSLEQSQIEISNRLLAAHTGLSFADIEGDKITNSVDQDRINEAENYLSSLSLKVIDSSSSRLSQIVASARAGRRHGLRLLILDYLQLLRPDDERVPREQQVATISRALKRLARELDVVVVCLAQLNRDIESRDRKQPRLSDLRESGSLEQDADVVLFLDRPAAYDPDADSTEANIIIAKNRNGPCGRVPLHWDGPTMTFRSQASSSEQELTAATNWFPPPTR